jgi:hypothetical protein
MATVLVLQSIHFFERRDDFVGQVNKPAADWQSANCR